MVQNYMDTSDKLILLKLERSRHCFSAAIKRAETIFGFTPLEDWSALEAPVPTSHTNAHGIDLQGYSSAAGLEVIREHLRRARRATDAAASCVEASCAVSTTVAEAAEALLFVAAAVTTPRREQLFAEAAAAHAVVSRLSLTIAQRQQHAASDATKRVTSAPDYAAAASAALQAQEAAGLAMWALRIGGCDARHSQEMPNIDIAALRYSATPAAPADATIAAAWPVRQSLLLEPLQKRPRLLEVPSPCWISAQPHYCCRSGATLKRSFA